VNVDRALVDESPAARLLRPVHSGLSQAWFRPTSGLFMCGDHGTTASINGALASGRLCAEAIGKDLLPGRRG